MESKGTGGPMSTMQERALEEWLRPSEGEEVGELDARIWMVTAALEETAKHQMLQLGLALVDGSLYEVAQIRLDCHRTHDALKALYNNPTVRRRVAEKAKEKDAEKAKAYSDLEGTIADLLRRTAEDLRVPKQEGASREPKPGEVKTEDRPPIGDPGNPSGRFA
jgi:hypothetical protein